MLVASNITMQFGAKPLFENVSVKFGEGFRYGLIGANGSGKSTFMKILDGELEPTAGNVSKDAHERVAYLRQDDGCSVQLSRLDQSQAPRCLEVRAASATNGFSVAPDGDAVYVALAVSDGTDIGIMPVPESASRPSLGVLKWLPVLGKPDS